MAISHTKRTRALFVLPVGVFLTIQNMRYPPSTTFTSYMVTVARCDERVEYSSILRSGIQSRRRAENAERTTWMRGTDGSGRIADSDREDRIAIEKCASRNGFKASLELFEKFAYRELPTFEGGDLIRCLQLEEENPASLQPNPSNRWSN
ncbi:hypothetical protein ACJ72_00782 [Emergomyces africanus]|uniref:Uncharacterized protein n=1 Tax=Emergomyces africanus TaxID=1955775 RepID=A0A1B7P748_9EURO|nr:hypothetical protein ACJ72_00782 [Emergomyces africanus]